MDYKTIKRIETKDFSLELLGTEEGFYKVKFDSKKYQSVEIPVQYLTAALVAFDSIYNSYVLSVEADRVSF